MHIKQYLCDLARQYHAKQVSTQKGAYKQQTPDKYMSAEDPEMNWVFCLPKTFVLKGQVAKHRNEIDVRDTYLSFTMSQSFGKLQELPPSHQF